ncbi:MAG: EAL domain-containing protein [Kofleriaceae bacterium]
MSQLAQSILLIEDNRGDTRLIREMINEAGSRSGRLTCVENMGEAEAYLADHHVDVMLLDLGLPDVQGIAALRRAHTAAPSVPLVVLTGLDCERIAAQALREGAQDYLIKGEIETRGLLRAMRYAIERKVMEDALFAEKERAQVTLDCIGDAVVCADSAGKISFLNRVAETMTGWSLSDAVGRPTADVLTIIDAECHEQPSPSERRSTNRILVLQDGREIPIEDSVAPIRDREGNATGAVTVFRDVSVARAMAETLVHTAQHDFLTGLPNRMLLHDRARQAISLAPRHEQKVAVLFLDLDNFKHINDSLGHPIGDLLLKSVAERLTGCVRNSDTISRQGGDEFVVLLSELAHTEDAAITAKRILETIETAHVIENHSLHITTSIGISVFPDDGTDADALIRNADTAMYQAKSQGRRNFQFFRPEMNEWAVERQSIEQALRIALERDEFVLHYQPKLNLDTGRITGVEALLRWTHPTRGPMSPAQFIPVAEDSGLIVQIGSWVLREACRQMQTWVAAGLPKITVAVNISAIELQQRAFLSNTEAILDETGMDPALLQLELTETVLMRHADHTATLLETLTAKGVQFALDDFGTGYSSLSYLRRFPISTLKIDQSFIRQIAQNSDEPLVSAVISMGRALDLTVVAEGVETRQELRFLRRHGCEEAQGYYFSRAVASDAIATLLERGFDRPVGFTQPIAKIAS